MSILISGASQGIGKSLALVLAETGAQLALVARNEAKLTEVAEQVTAKGSKVITISADVTKPEAAQSIVDQTLAAFEQIDCLINVAGIQPPIGPFLENDMDEWESAFQVNLFGSARLMQAVIPGMVKQGGGKIINFSGGGATAPRPNFSAYAASKAALVRLTETLALELEPYNIQINAVAPGAINTQMLEEVIKAGEKAGAEYQQALERNRTGGTPVELVCQLVMFLLSNEAAGITGKLISAPHDPWKEWSGKAEDLNKSPLYTIRRLDPFTIKPLIKELT